MVAGQVGWHTAVWFERQKYPWPLAQRENLFALHMEPSDGGTTDHSEARSDASTWSSTDTAEVGRKLGRAAAARGECSLKL